jgi:serine/threonine protein kinase/Tol biopolymer transport system component
MTLAPGTRLGAYEIIAPIGAGGMGEVYQARDTRLERDVAIKVLPDAFASDPDRIARFQREAKTLASLNHPQIGAIYGLEESNGIKALILELVEGPTLADRIAQGPIPLEEALLIAKQIAEALEEAHDHGIIHRDLKPTNVKVASDGRVKVLDFGLAKIYASDSVGSSSLSVSPTLSVQATYAGVILGTTAYMSPEQARGKPVDRRCDIWSFGCVLFEMLAGERPFESGETVSDAIAAILRSEPKWSALPLDVPAHITALLRRCLQKDPRKRLPHIGVVRLELEEGTVGNLPPESVRKMKQPKQRRWTRAAAVLLSALAVAGLSGVVGYHIKRSSQPSVVARFPVILPQGQGFTGGGRSVLAISSDGSQLVYAANDQLYLRRLADVEARPIGGTERGRVPLFAADGQSLIFYADGTLRKIALNGGAPITLCPAENLFGISWARDGIIFSLGSKGIFWVSAGGGQPEQIVTVGTNEVAQSPQMLPDGDHLLFAVTKDSGGSMERWDRAQIVVQSVSTGQRRVIVEGGADPKYISTGHLLYVLSGVLFAVPFDPSRLVVTGAAVPVVEGVLRGSAVTGASHTAISESGALIYVRGPSNLALGQSDLAFFDRHGIAAPLKLAPGTYEHPRLAPDGKRVVFGTDSGKDASVWIYELSGLSAMRRLTIGGRNKYPIWSGDGSHVFFQSDREGDLGIFGQRADGTGPAERLTRAPRGTLHLPESSHPHGDWLLFSESKGATKVGLMLLSLRDRKVVPFGGIEATTYTSAAFSPDGRWVAYSGRGIIGDLSAVFVQPFPATGTTYQLTGDRDAHHATWTADGREIAYIPSANLFATMKIATAPELTFSQSTAIPQPGAQGPPSIPRNYDMTGDGKRFVGVLRGGTSEQGNPQIEVVLNWFEELKRLVPLK